MSQIRSAKIEFNDPVNATDAVNLKYLNEKIDELKSLLSSAIVEFRNFNSQPIKTSQLENDKDFISKDDLKTIQKTILENIIKSI